LPKMLLRIPKSILVPPMRIRDMRNFGYTEELFPEAAAGAE